jgi:hypothetical protein
MKKIKVISSIVIALLFCYGNITAQTAIGPRIGVGIRLLNDNNEGDMGPGYQVGVAAHRQLTEKTTFIPGIDFSRKGYYHYENDWLYGENITISQKLSYIDFDLPVALKPGKRIYIYLGPQIGWLMAAALNSNYKGYPGLLDPTYYSEKYQSNQKKYMKAFDLGLTGGFGLKINEKIGLEGKLDYGLTEVYKKSFLSKYFQNTIDFPYNGKTFLATFGFYYLFTVSKKE